MPAFSGVIAVWAMADATFEWKYFAGTTAGLQAAIDSLAGGKGKVFVGPGTLLTTTAIMIHSGCHLMGAGLEQTIIKRQTGTMADGDANNSGNVLYSTVFGSTTISDSSHLVSSIQISDLTLDGNQSAFTTITNGSLGLSGMWIKSAAGLIVRNVKVINTLRSAFMIEECKTVFCDNIRADTVGQWGTSSTRNAVDLYNFNNATTGNGVDFSIKNFYFTNVGDEAFSLTNVSNVSISNGTVDGCDKVFELQGSTNTAIDKNVTMDNVVARNFTLEALILSSNNGHNWSNVTLSNCTFEGHATNHTSRMVALEPSKSNTLTQIHVSNCSFSNINSLDSSTVAWIDFQSNTGSSKDIKFDNCSFSGKAASTRTADSGVNILSPISDWTMTACTFRDVPGRGIRIHEAAGYQMNNLIFQGCIVDGCNSYGYQVAGETNTGSLLTNVLFDACIARDTAKQAGSDSGWQIISSGSSTAVSKVFLRGCRAYKTAGTTMLYGIDLNVSSGTLDYITIENCDFSGTVTAAMKNATGVPTNVHCTFLPGRGTDIASAATITIPLDGSVFHVTGTTNITNGITVKCWDNGRTVVLIFESTPTLSDTTTSKLAGNFVAAGTTNDFDSLVLTCDGTNWYENARSAN